jgi:tRNA-dihydrouridine synthase B
MTVPFLKLENKLILAPMHQVTNIAFRLMCKKYGASLVSTELLSASAIAKNNKAVMKLAKVDKKEKPIAIQLFGQNTEHIVKAAKKLKEFDIIDFNLGCPSKKILAQGSGAALLKRKNKIKEIVESVSKEIKKPFTVKIRNENAIDIAKICEKAGCSAITIHARTVKQGYSGKADWNLIKKIKQETKIPVIGNGDVWGGEDAKKILKQTNCDYVMIGRAAIGNPFIFKQILHFLETGEKINQTKKERIKDYFEYIKLAKKHGCFSLKDAKWKAQEFTKGLDGSSKLRMKLNVIKSEKEIIELMKKF